MNAIRGWFPSCVAFVAMLGFFVAIVLAGVAVAAIHIPEGDLEATFNADFKPKALSRTKPTPVALRISGNIKDATGLHPPSLRELALQSEKSTAIHVKGLPRCTADKLQFRDTSQAGAVCRSAIIGSGNLTAEIAIFEELVPTRSKIIAFNGGSRGGVTTLFIHAYLTVPVPATVVSTLRIKKVDMGPYGLLAVMTIPKIARGYGSVTHFDLTIDKRGVLTAKCPDGKLQIHERAVFSDGLTLVATLERPCTPGR